MVIGLAVVGGLVALLVLLDLTDYLCVRAGKQSPVPGWRRVRVSRVPVRERDDPRRGQGG
jgi:hypothetical protein